MTELTGTTCTGIAVLLGLAVALPLVSCVNTGDLFIEVPQNETICPGVPRAFPCITNTEQRYTLDGGDPIMMGAKVSYQSADGRVSGVLELSAKPNSTYSIICEARLNDQWLLSPPAIVTSEGSLSAPLNPNLSCSLNLCLLQWDPPYDALDPNLITYRVEVKWKLGSIIYTNTTNVIFNTSNSDICDVIEVAITPLCGTLYGTKSSVMRPIDDRRLSREDIVLRTNTSTNDCLAVLICLKDYPCNFSVLVGGVPLYSGVNGGCAWSPCLSRNHDYPGVLSTIYQNVSFQINTFSILVKALANVSTTTGHVTISCLFGLGSQAKGCLVVLVHNTSNDVVFVAIPREHGSAYSSAGAPGLSPGVYWGHAYSLPRDGTPLSAEANFAVNISVEYGGLPPTSATFSSLVTKGTAICWSHPGSYYVAIYDLNNGTLVYLNQSYLSSCSVDLPPGKYSIAVLPDTLGNTSVLGTWVGIPGTVTFQDDTHLLPLVALMGIAVVGIAIYMYAVLHYLWKRFKKVDTTNLGEGGEEELAWINPSHDAQGEGKSQVAISEGLPHARTARSPSSARSFHFQLLENINKPTGEAQERPDPGVLEDNFGREGAVIPEHHIHGQPTCAEDEQRDVPHCGGEEEEEEEEEGSCDCAVQVEHVLEDYSGGEGVASPQNDLHDQPMQGDDASCAEGEQRDIPYCVGEEEVMECHLAGGPRGEQCQSTDDGRLHIPKE